MKLRWWIAAGCAVVALAALLWLQHIVSNVRPLWLPSGQGLVGVCGRGVAGMRALQHELGLPYAGQHGAIRRQPGDFDVNTYFEVLDRLAVQPGYVLDYVMYGASGISEPMLYARQADSARYETYGEFSQARQKSYDYRGRDASHLESITVEDSEEGYLQLAIFWILGSQFYRYEQSARFDIGPICDSWMLEAAIRDYQWSYCNPITQMSGEVQDTARALDLSPQVELADGRVLVSLVTFGKWSGFTRLDLSFDSSFPHRLFEESRVVLVDFHCTVIF